MKQPAFWAATKAIARKLIPSRSVRWTVLYVPGFTLGLLFAIKAFGGMDDLFAYVIESCTRSLPLMIGIAIVYVFATGLGWNLNNDERAYYQRVLAGCTFPDEPVGNPIGAFLILAGEMLSILSLLAVILLAMLVWQG